MVYQFLKPIVSQMPRILTEFACEFIINFHHRSTIVEHLASFFDSMASCFTNGADAAGLVSSASSTGPLITVYCGLTTADTVAMHEEFSGVKGCGADEAALVLLWLIRSGYPQKTRLTLLCLVLLLMCR